jgi:hypothetical protein
MRRLLLLLPLSCNGSPSRVCTDIGCTDGFSLMLNHAWTEGSYSFEVALDSDVVRCTANIPLDRSGGCDDERVQLVLSGSELPVAEQSIPAINVLAADLTTITVAILRGDEVLTESSFTPTWETSQPNGPDCEPTCRTAEAALMF